MTFLKKQEVLVETWYSSPTKDSSPADWTKKVEEWTSIDPWRTWNVIQNITRLPILLTQFDFDAIWQSRMLLPYLFKADKLIQKPVVFDIDDAIWINEGKTEVADALADSTKVFAGNEYLAEWCRQHNKNTLLIPTTVDIEKYFPLEKQDDFFSVGWIGTPSNFKYLELAAPAIRQLLSQMPGARIVIVSSEAPAFFSFDEKQFVFRKWEAEKENELINQFDVGIMPLPDDEWTRGKCGFKLLQYMACSKPVIASPVGMNEKLLSTGTGLAATNEADWLNALQVMYHDKALREECGTKGRQLVTQHYNASSWSSAIASELKSLIS